MEPKPTDKVTWSERHDLVIQIASPEVAAEKLGLTVKVCVGAAGRIRTARPAIAARATCEAE